MPVMRFRHQIGEALGALEAAGLLRRPRTVKGPQGPEIDLDGRRVLCFCSNNYLGLADHPHLLEAADHEDGFGSGASRLITGTMHAHEVAERELAAPHWCPVSRSSTATRRPPRSRVVAMASAKQAISVCPLQ